MAQNETVVRAVFEAEERGVAKTASAVRGLESALGDMSKAQNDNVRSSQTVAQSIVGVERSIDAMNKRLAGAPSAWNRYEASMRTANAGMKAGQLSAEEYAQSVQRIQRELQRVVAPRLDMDVSTSGLSTLLGTTEKVSAAQREAANEALRSAQVRRKADAEVARSQEMLSEQAAKLRSDLNPLGAAYAKLAKDQADYAEMARRGLITQDELSAANNRARRGFDEFSASLNQGPQRLGLVQQAVTQLRTAVVSLVGAYATFATVRAIGGMADEWSDLQSRVSNATGSLEAGRATLERLGEMAARTYSPLNQTTESWLNQKLALDELGLSTAKQMDLMETLNNSLVISATRGQQAESVQRAWSNAMATGALRLDGLNTILSNSPRLAKALADSLGVSTNQLRRMASDGTLTANKLVGVSSQLEATRVEADGMAATIGDGMVRIRNSLLQFVGAADQAGGASSGLADQLVGISDWLDSNRHLASVIGNDIAASIAAFVNFGTDIATAYAAIQGEITAVRDWFAETSTAINDFVQDVVDWFDLIPGASAEAARLLPQGWEDAMRQLHDIVSTGVQNVVRSMATVPAMGHALREGLLGNGFAETFEAEQQRFVDLINGVGSAVGDAVGFHVVLDEVVVETAESVGVLNDSLGETPGQATAAAETISKEMEKAGKAFEAQIRTLRQNSEAMQRQIDMFGATSGATAAAELRARELARAWDIAREAGLSAIPAATMAAIDGAAASVENLTNQLQRMNLERGQSDALRMLEAEASLIGLSADARKIAMAGLQAETDLRRQNIVTTDEWGQSYIRNAQNAAGMRVEIDRQTKAYETQQKFVENVLSTSLDALFNIGAAESWGDAVLGIFADIGRQFQELAKQNLMQALFGQNYTTGQLAPGQRSIAQPGSPAGFGSLPVAANQNVPPGGALNIGAVQALNTNLQRSSRSALDVARQFDGLNERADSAVLDSFMQASGNWRNLSAADTAWCAAFANAAIVEAGGRGTGSNLASSFMGWGQGTNAPQVGDIVVLKPQSAGASGHVGFVAGFGDGKVQVFGGNQSNAANTRSFGLDQVRGYRTGVGVGGAGIGGSFAMPQMAAPVYAPQMSSAAQQAMAQGWSGFGPVPGQAGSSRMGLMGQNGRISQFMQSPIGQMGMLGLGAFGSGYSSGSAGSGALSGGLTGFMTAGPVGGLVGLVGGALGGLFGGRQKREQEHQQKAQAWGQMAPQFDEYQRMLREDTGPSSGLRSAYGAIDAQMEQFVGVGSAAWKRGSNNSSALFDQVSQSRVGYQERTNQAFQRRYWGTLDSLENGRGMAGPFVEAQDAITELGKTLSTFVDDTRLVFGDGSLEAQRAAEASISQLRAMLTGGRELTEVGEAVQRMEGAAAALRYELTQLGVSAEDAGSAVSADLASAMGQLRGDFAQGIQDQLWSLDGKGYIAEFRQFFTDIDGAIQDALLVGADRGLVDELFVKQAQSMVDGAQLSGDAFAELITAMPRLSGVVREFSAAAEEAAKRTTDQIDALRLSYGDRTFEASNDNSTEAGSLARFDRYAAREREEELRLGGEAILDLERALAAERGQIVKQFADRAADAMKSAIERYDDRAFAATNTDDLAAFERQIVREREEAVRIGGDALVAFERMAAAERGQIVKAQADLAREQMQALDLSRYDAALRARADAENALRQEYQRTVSFVGDLKGFLDGIRLDQDLSTLSATDRLAEAEKQYRETLALAQGGDKDAQDRLVSSSEAYLREARDYYATSEQYGAIYAEINGSLKNTVAKAETDLDLARRQAGSLVDLVTGQKSMTVLLAEYLKAAQEVMSQFGRVNESRGWGTNEAYNRSLVDALSKAGLNYTGSFGQGGYQSWLAGLSPADRQRAEGIGSGLSGAPASRNWGVNAAANQGYVNALAGIGLNYGGAFGSGGFQSYLGGLSAADRERARGVLGFQSGGFTGMGPTNAVAGVVHGQEFVAHAEATRRWRPQLEAMNAGHLPQIAMPRAVRTEGGNDNSALLSRIDALTAEVRALKAISAQGSVEIAEAVREGTSAQREVGSQLKRANSR